MIIDVNKNKHSSPIDVNDKAARIVPENLNMIITEC